ncbi:hypothetical protein GGS24DRAFT_480429 [Hypoxylon argillaceum]|nr:hypothetical protein GGS24DRAFT_480429 [Hypoxylon argillaceum]
MDENWNQDGLNTEDLAATVGTIHLVAFPNPINACRDGGIASTNHWCLFLGFLRVDRSVRIDIVPGNGSDGLLGSIAISSKDYAYTDNRAHKLSYQVNQQHLIVGDVIELLRRNGRQRYRFTPEREGCRYWTYVVIRDLERAEILSPGAAHQAWEAMSRYYHAPSSSSADTSGRRAGSFYD